MKRINKIALSIVIPAIISYSNFLPEKIQDKNVMDVYRVSNNINEIKFENIFVPLELQEYRDMTPARLVKEHLPKTEKFVQKEGEKYVLMINADVAKHYEFKRDDDIRFRKNIDSMYKAFRHNGIKKENITVLQGGKNNPDYVVGRATLEEITNKTKELKEKITDNDFLIIYFTNHGTDNDDGKSYLSLDDNLILSEDKFNELFENFNYDAAFFISAPCKNYNNALHFAGGNKLALSFSGQGKNVVGGGSQKLAESLFGVDKYGKKLEQDYNRDGKRSLAEIIKWAALNNDHTNPVRMMSKPGDTSKFRREAHHLIYQNADPERIFLD